MQMCLLAGADEFFAFDADFCLNPVLQRAIARAESRQKLGWSKQLTDYIPKTEVNLQYRTFFEQAPFGAAILDGTGHLAVTNKTLQDMLGYSEQEFQDLSVADITHPEDLARDTGLFMEVLAGERDHYQIEKRYVRKTGAAVWTNLSMFVERGEDGMPQFGFGLAEDITARKQAENALRESELSIRELYRVSASREIPEDEKVRHLLEMGCRRFGLPTGILSRIDGDRFEILEAHSPDLELVRGQVFQLGELYCCDTVRSQAPLAIEHAGASEWRAHPCYTTMQAETYLGAPVFVDGEIHGTLCFSGGEPHSLPYTSADKDLLQLMARWIGGEEERKRREKALQSSQQQLMQAQKMEAVGRLTGGVAHDFNNLIMAIRGNLELLLKEGNWDPVTRSDLLEIDGAARRGAQLTQQLLAFSRQQVLSPQVLDLNTRISDMNGILSRLVGESVELVLRLDPAIGSVEADPGQIDQIILNLVVNGRDAMPEGGAIVVETGDVEITEAEAKTYPYPVRSGPYVQLSVRDSGCGMDEDTMSRIFEPFFSTKGQRGTGLGLSTVYGIVKQSGGYIWVESEEGKGTIFRIHLPRIQTPVGSQNCPSASADSHRGSETVLLVEDEVMIRKLTRRMLQGSGYAVLEAASPAAAIALCESHPGPIHLIVTDLLMPGMNGRELADRLNTIRPGVPVLYLSGYASDTALQLGMLEPGTAFLQKPVDSQRLTSTVRNLLAEFPVSPSGQTFAAPDPVPGRIG